MTIDEEEEITLNHLPYYLLERIKRDKLSSGFNWRKMNRSYHDMIDDIERKIILEELVKWKWNVTKTAEMLNIKRQTLQNKIKRLGIDEINNFG